MESNFLDSFFYKNYKTFKETRGFLDGYVLHEYLKFNKDIKSSLEIGVYKGAIFSLVAETTANVNCILIDPDMNNVKQSIPHDMFKNTICIESKSDDINWNDLPQFDLIIIDGDHVQPHPTNDIKNCLSKTKNNTIILLDDYVEDEMYISRNFLKKNGWTPWLKLDQMEWWSKQELMSFIHYILKKNEIQNFSRIYQGGIDDDCKWRISSPQAIYENVSIIEKYIK